jgi:hypothetical protein
MGEPLLPRVTDSEALKESQDSLSRATKAIYYYYVPMVCHTSLPLRLDQAQPQSAIFSFFKLILHYIPSW